MINQFDCRMLLYIAIEKLLILTILTVYTQYTTETINTHGTLDTIDIVDTIDTLFTNDRHYIIPCKFIFRFVISRFSQTFWGQTDSQTHSH